MAVELVQYGAALGASIALSLYLTPFIRSGAASFNIVDRPDGVLKQQREPVPYLGGVAVYLAFLLALSFVFEFSAHLLGLLLGGTMVAMLGLFDDLHVIAPRFKLAGQLLAAWVMLRSDISIQLGSLPQALAVPLTIAWLVGITNAINIIDVSDGLAAGVAAVAGLGLFTVAVLNDNVIIATATLALVGSLVGFLRYNRAPARIYLGDTGSLFVGFMLAALAMIGAYTQQSQLGALAPVLILIVPILDTTLVTLARLSRGESPFKGSNDHFAVRLRARGWPARRVARAAYALGLLGAVAGVALVLVPATAALAILGAMAALFLTLLALLWRARPEPEAELLAGTTESTAGQAGI